MILPVILFFISLVLFALFMQLPVEVRVQVYLPSVRSNMTEEEFARLMQLTAQRYGIDQPTHIQYIHWITNLARGEWGYSPTWRQPVLQGLLQRAPATIELAVFTLVPSILLAFFLGLIAAKYQHGVSDYAVRMFAFAGWAFPSFIFGILLMNVLYAWLKWFPPERSSLWVSAMLSSGEFKTYTGFLVLDGLLNGDLKVSLDALRHLVLPGLTLAFFNWALFVRIMRSSLLDVLQEDYITTARSKGLAERVVINLHAGRNAILPLISSAGVTTSVFFSSVMIIEVLFNFNGIGRWAVEAVKNFDVPAALGFVLVACLVAVIASLISDIVTGILDPRVRSE